jgi:glycosyltransferase involved in cell wall biosynthesis
VRILHVVQPTEGGAVAAMLLLVRDQVDRHEVGVVCNSSGSTAELAQRFGATVWTVPFVRPVSPRADARHLRRVFEIARGFRPDVVHVHSSKAGVLGRLAARAHRTPVVFSPHNFAYRAYEGSAAARAIFYLVERAMARWTDCLHVVSDDEYENAIRHRMSCVERCAKVRNGIDLEPLLRVAPPPVRTPPVVGTFARLSYHKGIYLFLVALAELRRRAVPFRGLLIGDGPLREQLAAHARGLGLEQVVELDATPHDAVAALQRMDVFALTSSHECGPLSIMEAMAAERAVIATSVGVVPEIVTSGRSGLVVPSGDPSAFADALQQAIEDVPLRRSLGAAARDEARRQFGSDVMSRRMEAVYATALSRRRTVTSAERRSSSE